MNEIYIWQDSNDLNYYHFANKTGSQYNIWFSLFIDAISDMFGKEIYCKIKEKCSSSPNKFNLKINLED